MQIYFSRNVQKEGAGFLGLGTHYRELSSSDWPNYVGNQNVKSNGSSSLELNR